MKLEEERYVFSISELNQLVKDMLDGEPLFSRILVRGEISNYKKYPSGHHYFTLKDQDSTLKCVMFKREGDKLKFKPENGMNIIAQGRLSVFPRDGVYQLYCTDLVADGAGALSIAFEQLKKKLHQEGLFAPEHKKPLPQYPEKIAIVTSSAGAAVRDMIRILGQRYPIAQVLLLPVRVQGAEAPAEIVGAIKYANRHKIADVLITGRGGGSLEDLWAFNDERVARAIYDSEIPVISAVGHEPDVTISDFVADRRASTPSNAAEIAVPNMADLISSLDMARARIKNSVAKKTEASREKLDALASSRSMRDPMNYIQEKKMLLDHSSDRLISAQERTIAAAKHDFVELAAKIDALSPVKVLVRGYSMARSRSGEIVKSIKQTKVGDKITVEMSDGSALCTVEELTGRNDHV